MKYIELINSFIFNLLKDIYNKKAIYIKKINKFFTK